MQRQDFSFDLPPELIAQMPLAERSASRLLIVDPKRDCTGPRDGKIQDLAELLQPGDLLVFNDTKVVAARLRGTKASGGRVELFLERALGETQALVQLRASKPIRPGLQVTTPGGLITIVGRQDDLWRIETPGPALDFFERWGEVPLPPYIHRAADSMDRDRYQSVFARERGAVAAPTASLHFDAALLAGLEARGARRAFVTLHVGAGTFQPIRTTELDSHVMHAEQVSIPPETCASVNRTLASGARVIAIGTTVVRALESAAASLGSDEPAGSLPSAGWSGETRLFIRPGFRFRATSALLTNFHLPESTLLMLVCAFAGTERILAAYRHAVQARYRFFSYGDAMFVLPERSER